MLIGTRFNTFFSSNVECLRQPNLETVIVALAYPTMHLRQVVLHHTTASKGFKRNTYPFKLISKGRYQAVIHMAGNTLSAWMHFTQSERI